MTLLLGAGLAACDGDAELRPAPEVFTHGVASGSVSDGSAVLWTRAHDREQLVAEVARDAAFDDVIDSIEATTAAKGDGTASVAVTGLEPDTRYFYRFRAGHGVSDTGVFVTAPRREDARSVRFVFGGDADGRRNADGSPVHNEMEVLRAAASENPSFFLFLGDTIYGDRDPAAFTVEEYRAKYRQNREYDALRSILAATSTYVMWDDHEVVNDFAGETVDRARFEAGRQAFREYWPLAGGSDPSNMYGSFRWGSELELITLDTRSFRSGSAAEVCTGGGLQPDPLPAGAMPDAPAVLATIREFVGLPPALPPECAEEIARAERTMLGAEQEAFLEEALLSSDATWKVIVSSVPVQEFYALPYDRWEGYPAARERLLSFLRGRGINNVVFLTTDMHASLFGPVRMETSDDGSPIAYEAVVGPIATDPLAEEIDEVIGAGGAAGFEALLTGVAKADCVELASYAYGVVEVDAEAGTLTVAAKDAHGRVVCEHTLTAR